jgi:hypothetical protein
MTVADGCRPTKARNHTPPQRGKKGGEDDKDDDRPAPATPEREEVVLGVSH